MFRRGARTTAPLALVGVASGIALSGCSSGGSGHQAAAAATAAAPDATTPTNPAAARLLSRAESTLPRLRSYRFDAVETVAAKTPVTTRIDGSVVRGQGVSYTLSVGRTRTQVVRIQGATYVRAVPGHWARLHRPRPVADPTASLTEILHDLTNPSLASPTTFVGTLSRTGARAAGIPSDGAAEVTVLIDRDGRVTRVSLHTTVKAATKAFPVTLTTTYSAFDAVRPLGRPG